MTTLKLIVEGGKATPGPPLGPSLAPLGVNVGQVVAKINEQTKPFEGIKVPVTVEVKPDKSYTIKVGSPSVSALIKKELGIEAGAGKRKEAACGDLKMEQIIKIAKLKKKDVIAKSDAAVVKQVIGTCVSVGCTVDGKDPKEVKVGDVSL